MQKILILANSDMGLYKFRKELIVELVKNHHVFVACPKGTYTLKLIDLGVEFNEVKMNRHSVNPISEFRLFIELFRKIKLIKPDLIMTYTIKPNIYGGIIARILTIGYITTITGLGSTLNNGIKSLFPNLMYRIALKKAKMVFFQNQHNLDYMISRRIVKDNIVLVPGSGVNIDEYSFKEYPSDIEIHFIFVGRLMKAKGIEDYLWLAKTIKEKHDNISFHVIGSMEEDYFKEIEELVEERIINYHGSKESVHEYYEMCHAIIHPSKYSEGISNVLLEAASTGKPILTTKIPGCKETFVEGKTGFGFEHSNKIELLEKFEQFLKLSHSTKEKMGIESRNWIESRFERGKVVDEYMRVIESI